MLTGRGRLALLAIGIAVAGSAAPARADGYPPFYGYSGYFGRPSTYFTPENDVHQATTMRDDSQGFGTRTYYRGGPFWTYRSVHRGFGAAPRPSRRRTAVLRRKG